MKPESDPLWILAHGEASKARLGRSWRCGLSTECNHFGDSGFEIGDREEDQYAWFRII